MKLQEFKKVDSKNYEYFDLCYQVYRFLKSPELYQVIEKFDGKEYTKRFETALKNCAKSLTEKGYIDALNLTVTPESFSSPCWLATFIAHVYFWIHGHYSERISFNLLRNETKLNVGNTILKDNAFTNINDLKKALRKNVLSFLKTVKNYEEIKKEIDQKQKEFKTWHDLIMKQYSWFVLEKMGLKY
jgi:hypothetical protein